MGAKKATGLERRGRNIARNENSHINFGERFLPNFEMLLNFWFKISKNHF